jgi:hypothetical protein
MLTQGMVFYGNKSPYYRIPCYGVIITARCDLAHSKVENVHYLTAITLNDWLLNDCLAMIVEELIKENISELRKWMETRSLNPRLLLNFGPNKTKILIDEYEKQSKQKERLLKYIESWVLCEKIRTDQLVHEDIINVLNVEEAFMKKKKNKVNQLIKNQLTGYYYIPGTEINIEENGIVVNLRDINQLHYSVFLKMLNGKIDCLEMDEQEKRQLSSHLFLERIDDFAYIECTISSPRIEHLLQNFSQLFCRIGLEDLSEDYIEKLKNLHVV